MVMIRITAATTMIPIRTHPSTLTARTRAGDHEVSAELKIERCQGRIVAGPKVHDALVGGCASRLAQFERYTTDERPVNAGRRLAQRHKEAAWRA